MQTQIDFVDEYFKTHVPLNTPLGIFCSGGYDSTTLAYYVFKRIQEQYTMKTLTVFTVPRHDDSRGHSIRILAWLTQCFPEVIVNHEIVGDPDLHHSQQVASGIHEAVKKYKDMIVLLGDTAIPDELRQDAPHRVVSKFPRIVQPFIYLDKTATVSLSQELGILDTVAGITHTCTQSLYLRCSQCWQCRERAWAFSMLNLNDTGAM